MARKKLEEMHITEGAAYGLKVVIRVVLVLFLLCIAMELFLGWFNDHESCLRQANVRSALNLQSQADYNTAQRLSKRAAAEPTAACTTSTCEGMTSTLPSVKAFMFQI